MEDNLKQMFNGRKPHLFIYKTTPIYISFLFDKLMNEDNLNIIQMEDNLEIKQLKLKQWLWHSSG
jgi:hypothetical protein